MTIAALRNGAGRHYALTDQSDAVGAEAAAWQSGAQKEVAHNSVTIEQRQAELFWRIVAARAESLEAMQRGDAETPVTDSTVEAAIQLLHALPSTFPDPDINAESFGDITFEWYKDRHHGAILAVDGQQVRWSAILGTAASTSGHETYAKSVPGLALQAIRAAIG